MRREQRWKGKGLHRLFFFFVLLPMLCVFPYVRAVNNPNELVRVFTVMSLVESGTFRIDEQVATYGWVNDMARVPSEDGRDHYYMVKAPLVVYAGIPGYALFSKVVAPLLGKKYPGVYGGRADPPAEGHAAAPPSSEEERLWWLRMSTWVMRLFASQIPCFLFLLWFERYLRDFSRDPAIRYGAVAAAGLGTNFFAYTHMFASHSQYAALAFLAFATIERERRLSGGYVPSMRISRAVLAGLCTSACVALEYHALPLAIVLSAFAAFTFYSPARALAWALGWVPGLRSLREWVPAGTSLTPTRLLAFMLGGLINVLHVMYFHWSAYGNPFTPGHHQLDTAAFVEVHQKGLFGIMWPTWDRIAALAVSPNTGFFGMSPFMWLGLLAVPLLLLSPKGPPGARAHLRVITLVWFACMIMAFGVNAGFLEWRGGWTIGPRYLVVCAPFFAFGAACALERFASGGRVRRALARGVGGGLALAGVVTIGTVGLVYDTLPEQILRPFTQFTIPMARVGLVPHHIGEWFGWTSTTLWYLVCGAMLLAPLVAGLAIGSTGRGRETAARAGVFLLAFALGMAPALSRPEDGSARFVLHPSTLWVANAWEPQGRDRISLLREEATHAEPGQAACLWYHVADLERVLGRDALAARAEARAAKVLPRQRCSSKATR